jgi:uncharacterized repeat protein (TIGR03806 family)
MRLLKRARACAAVALACALCGCDSGAPTRASGPPTSGTPPPSPPTPPPAQTPGLDARPVNTTCLAWPRSEAGDGISLTRFTNHAFSSPVALLQAPNDNLHWYVVQQGGVVRRFDPQSTAAPLDFVDITARVASGGEMGLLGMAFHPAFPADRRVFLSYTASGPRRSVISEFVLAANGASLDPASERVLLTVLQPESNHKGGGIAFGSDSLLYIGLGDGGGGGDDHGTIGNGQNLQTLLGKMIRIDVRDTSGAVRYLIPPGNPFANGAVCDATGATTAAPQCAEIYAYGFRNPWRWSFDRSNADLWVADVGQSAWEEVNRVSAGGNYGWRCREGAHDFASGRTPGCETAQLIDPVAEYGRSQGVSITGGYVYRGAQNTALSGRFLFGDFGSGRIWAWIAENANGREPTRLLDSGLSISAFGQGNDGELYVVDYGGALYRINFSGGGGASAPTNLSATGCVNPNDPKQPAAGLIPYGINAPFWSDDAEKDRWVALPEGQRITIAANGDWELPTGAVLVKTFRLGTRLIETRLFMRHPDGAWGGFSYEWNPQQTDATLVPGGASRDLGGGRQWVFPSETQCLQCHTSAAGRSLGLETAQLNRDFIYPQTGRTADQLYTLSHIGTFVAPVTNPASEPALADPADASASLDARARAYLHTNCSQCHRPGGPTPTPLDLRATTALGMTNACNIAPQSGDLGIGASARLIAPGSAANSLVVQRMNRRDQHAMPPLASTQVDTAGVALISQWVNGLTGC